MSTLTLTAHVLSLYETLAFVRDDATPSMPGFEGSRAMYRAAALAQLRGDIARAGRNPAAWHARQAEHEALMIACFEGVPGREAA